MKDLETEICIFVVYPSTTKIVARTFRYNLFMVVQRARQRSQDNKEVLIKMAARAFHRPARRGQTRVNTLSLIAIFFNKFTFLRNPRYKFGLH